MGTILGTDGNDILESVLNDTLIGYAGDDEYRVGSTADKPVEALNQGIDKIYFKSNFDVRKTTSYTIAPNVENLNMLDWDFSSNPRFSSAKRYTINGNALVNVVDIGDANGSKLKVLAQGGNDTVNGGTGNDYIDGGAGNDIILGGLGNDSLYGGNDHDSINGGDGDDLLSGGAGNDILRDTIGSNTLDGGAGNDTYYIDGADATTIKDTGGIDTIISDGTINSIASYTTIDVLDVSSSVIAGLEIIGNSISNTLLGGSGGTNTLSGGLGNDTYVIQSDDDEIVEAAPSVKNSGIDTVKITGGSIDEVDLTSARFLNVENIDASSSASLETILTGSSVLNTITGSAFDDTIFGGNDNLKDLLSGADGSDTYIIKNQYDIINEKGTGVGDVDTIKLDAEFDNSAKTPDAAVYNLTNAAIEAVDGSDSAKALTLTTTLKTSVALAGGSGKDTITGGISVDALYGNENDDILNGGKDSVIDYLTGGAGNDTYILRDTQDVITDIEGDNIIKLDATFSPNSLSLQETSEYDYSGSNILTIDATAITSSAKGLALTGNAASTTTIKGGAGFDIITGGSASDTLYGNAGNDNIKGGADIDTLYGGLGNDMLDGEAGDDSLYGGLGNDTYYYDNSNETVVEYANEGNDTLKLGVAGGFSIFSLNNPIYDNIENVDASDYTTTMYLHGNSLSNILIGGSAKDFIYGGEGADTLIGGRGSDVYYVNNSSNKVIENADEGTDEVVLAADFNSSSFSLVSNVEFLDATRVKKAMNIKGSSDSGTMIYATTYGDKITGGSSKDIIMAYGGNDSVYAGDGEDTIDGGTGSDYLDGGAGNDTIYGGQDTLVDTLVGGDGSDTYQLSDSKDIIRDTSTGNIIELKHIFDEASFSLSSKTSGTNYSGQEIDMLYAHSVETHGLLLVGNNTTKTVTTIIPATDTEPEKKITTQVGKDIKIFGTTFGDTIVSYAGNDYLRADNHTDDYYGSGNDTFYAGAGKNEMLGGVGNDVYLIDGLASSTTIVEKFDQEVDWGYDTIKLIANNGGFDKGFDSSLVYKKGTLNNLDSFAISLADYSNVEKLDASLILETDLTLTGNDAKGGNLIIGGTGDDLITGGGDMDVLYGGDGNDTLDGAGATKSEDDPTKVNTLYGEKGNDIYNITIDNEGAYEVTIIDLEGEEQIISNTWQKAEYDDLGDLTKAEYIPVIMTHIGEEADEGVDTIKFVGKSSYPTGKDVKSFADQEKFRVELAANVENFDASAIKEDITVVGLYLMTEGNSLDNHIIGSGFNDRIYTYDGDDTVEDYSTHHGAIIDTGDGDDTVRTGRASDYIITGNGHDSVIDEGGNNTVDAGDGDNRVFTGGGHDDITSGSGNDYIIAGDGNDTISSGDGNDIIWGGAGNDTINGGLGNDIFNFAQGDSKDYLLGLGDGDKIDVDVATGIDTSDILFYSDDSGNLYMDYTDGSIGSDRVKIAAGQYDDNAVISVGAFSLYISTLTQYLSTSGSEYTGLDSGEISGLNTADKAAQVSDLAAVWSDTFR